MSGELTHTTDSIIDAFNEIDSGEIDNTHFLNANVVMLSKSRYNDLMEQLEFLKQRIEIFNSVKYTKILD